MGLYLSGSYNEIISVLFTLPHSQSLILEPVTKWNDNEIQSIILNPGVWRKRNFRKTHYFEQIREFVIVWICGTL